MKAEESDDGETHRALGNNVAEELLVDLSSVSLLLEVETKQHSDLRLVGLIVWIHLERKHVAPSRPSIHYLAAAAAASLMLYYIIYDTVKYYKYSSTVIVIIIVILSSYLIYFCSFMPFLFFSYFDGASTF